MDSFAQPISKYNALDEIEILLDRLELNEKYCNKIVCSIQFDGKDSPVYFWNGERMVKEAKKETE